MDTSVLKFYVYRSDKKQKKYYVEITGTGKRNKKVYFGASGYSDFTIHKDPERKNRYINRHEKRENWNDPSTSGFWSRWILWNKPTISASIFDTQKMFGIKIINSV